jgi:fluoride exporter
MLPSFRGRKSLQLLAMGMESPETAAGLMTPTDRSNGGRATPPPKRRHMNSILAGYFSVFVGGGLGAMARHAVNRWGASSLPAAFPYATLIINVAGSLLMGVLIGWLTFRQTSAHPGWRLFLATGILGGFTTFSTFSLEVALLWERGRVLAMGAYVAASLVIGVGALFVGMWSIRALSIRMGA